MVGICSGIDHIDAQREDLPSLNDVLAALYLESDDPNQNNKIKFENNVHIPEAQFPEQKQKILLLAYSRYLFQHSYSL